jgi:predicted ArsR family transcriptional regulator
MTLFDVSENRPGPSHHNAPETSARAAVANAPRSGTQRWRVLRAVSFAGWTGLTDDEIGSKTGLHGNAVRPRRGELVKAGFVEDSGLRRPSVMGNPAVVWTATRAGREALRG